MAKKVKTIVKLQCKAGQANPAPPVGPALGQHGLNIMDFCQKFNEQTKKMAPDTLVPTEITVFEDRTFDFKIKTPPASFLLKLKKVLAIRQKIKSAKSQESKLEKLPKRKCLI